ncbi:MAG: hypothetical protein Q9162_000637 [Coniocarpon cinnabarinum]
MLGRAANAASRQTKQTTLSFGVPPAKRRKVSPPEKSPTLEHRESEDHRLSPHTEDEHEEEEQRRDSFVPQLRRIIPDSDAEDEDEDIEELQTEPQQTDLEQTLPPIKTDKEAIEEYEAMRKDDNTEREQRLENGEWVKGRSSIYVDAFNLALETVLEEERHLFDESERMLFEHWKKLEYEYQYLYVRLFLRKTHAWFRINSLGHYRDVSDMERAVQSLLEKRHLPSPSEEEQVSPGELQAPEGTTLETTYTFAESSDDHINTLEEASSLLKLDELRYLAKEAKVQGKNKKELLKNLRNASGKQTAIGYSGLQRSDTNDSGGSPIPTDRDDSPIKQVPPDLSNRDAYFTRQILSSTGPCIRLSLAPCKLFERVHLVFYRSTEWTEKSLTTIILARIARRNFPPYVVSRSANIFASRSSLLEFEASLRTQFRIDSVLEFNGTPTKDGLQGILDIFEDVLPRWRHLLREEQQKENSIYASGEGSYLRRLSPAWVYTRIVHKGAYVLGLGKFKDHLREHGTLTELLNQRLFHPARRGVWYTRKALLEEHYMASLQPREDRTDAEQKRHWKRVALSTCEEGLQDNLTHLIHHHDLQKRLSKLERQLKVPKRLQHDFGHARLAKPAERTFQGIQLVKSTLPAKPAGVPRLIRETSNATPTRRGAKTIWLNPDPERVDEEPEVSVEEMCLAHYRRLGWSGHHTEGGILRTLFALLFYDVLFAYVPAVFQTPFQTCPLDLHTDAFFPTRMSEINARLADVANGTAAEIVRGVWEREEPRRTCVVGLRWERFTLQELVCICRCFGGQGLSCVMRVMCQEYAQRGGGVPDLFLWRTNQKTSGRSHSHPGEAEESKMVDDPAQKNQTQNGNGSALKNRNETEDKGNDVEGGDEREDEIRHDESIQGEVLFAEVKSENDRLSDTQRLWIDVLTGAGIAVELCHAVASEVRVKD